MKAFLNLIILILVAGSLYHYRAEIGQAAWVVKDRYFSPAPCTQPLKYSVGTFDSKFGISQAQFLADVEQAGKVWSTVEGKNLFVYDASNDGVSSLASHELKLNLIYDYRQRATSQMQSLNTSIQGNLSTYDELKAKYDSMSTAYKAQKARVDALTAQYAADKQKYETDVAYWNSRGGAPQQEFARIEAERSSLNAESTQLNQQIAALNDAANVLNTTGKQLNGLASGLNSTVKTYNTIGASTGPEFDEGQYVEDATGRRIDIYQFSTNDMLVRVLAHELGHALGLDHVADPDAIMYRLNSSKNSRPTADDITELKRICKN